jgi:hypothetical protein
MQQKRGLNPKYTAIIGAILAITGFAFSMITRTADVIIVFFTIILGIILFFIGVAGLLSSWYKRRKKI